MSRISHQLRSKKTRGPDVAVSVSRLIFMRCHDNAQSDTPQSSRESRTDTAIRARTIYTPNVTYPPMELDGCYVFTPVCLSRSGSIHVHVINNNVMYTCM